MNQAPHLRLGTNRLRADLRTEIRCLAVDDRGLVAAGGFARNIVLFDSSTGEERGELVVGADMIVEKIEISPDGSRLGALAGLIEHDIAGTCLWNLETRQRVDVPRRHAGAICFSPDGSLFVGACGTGHPRLVFDARSGKVEKELPAFREAEGCDTIAVSPDNELLLMAARRDEEGLLTLWSLESGKLVGEFPLEAKCSRTDAIAVAFTPHGEVTACWNGGVRRWNLRGGVTFEKRIARARYVPWRRFVCQATAVVGQSGFASTLKRIDVARGKNVASIPKINVAGASEAGLVATTDGFRVRIWSGEKLVERAAELTGPDTSVGTLGFACDAIIATCPREASTIHRFAPSDGRSLPPRARDAEIVDAVIDASGTRVLSLQRTDDDHSPSTVVVYDASSKKKKTLEFPDGVGARTMTPDGSLAAIKFGRAVRVLTLPAGRKVRELEGFSAAELALSADGSLLACIAYERGWVSVWSVKTGRRLAGHILHTRGRQLAFSRDGRFLAVTDRKQVHVVGIDQTKVKKGRAIAWPKGPLSVSFHPSGRWLGIVDRTGTSVYDLARGRERVRLDGETYTIAGRELAKQRGPWFSKDGDWVVTPDRFALNVWKWADLE